MKGKHTGWVCEKCGGSEIKIQAWIDPNTNEWISDAGPDGECWCNDCSGTTMMRHTGTECDDEDFFSEDTTITSEERPTDDWWIALNTPGCC